MDHIRPILNSCNLYFDEKKITDLHESIKNQIEQVTSSLDLFGQKNIDETTLPYIYKVGEKFLQLHICAKHFNIPFKNHFRFPLKNKSPQEWKNWQIKNEQKVELLAKKLFQNAFLTEIIEEKILSDFESVFGVTAFGAEKLWRQCLPLQNFEMNKKQSLENSEIIIEEIQIEESSHSAVTPQIKERFSHDLGVFALGKDPIAIGPRLEIDVVYTFQAEKIPSCFKVLTSNWESVIFFAQNGFKDHICFSPYKQMFSFGVQTFHISKEWKPLIEMFRQGENLYFAHTYEGNVVFYGFQNDAIFQLGKLYLDEKEALESISSLYITTIEEKTYLCLGYKGLIDVFLLKNLAENTINSNLFIDKFRYSASVQPINSLMINPFTKELAAADSRGQLYIFSQDEKKYKLKKLIHNSNFKIISVKTNGLYFASLNSINNLVVYSEMNHQTSILSLSGNKDYEIISMHIEDNVLVIVTKNSFEFWNLNSQNLDLKEVQTGFTLNVKAENVQCVKTLVLPEEIIDVSFQRDQISYLGRGELAKAADAKEVIGLYRLCFEINTLQEETTP